MKALTDAYGRRRLRELREFGSVAHLAWAQPEQLGEVLKDPDPQVFAAATNVERWWSYGGQG